MRKILLTLLTTLLCSVTAWGAQGVDYANGFESGTDSWTKSSMGNIGSETTNVRTGSKSLNVTCNNANGYLRKQVSVHRQTTNYIHFIVWAKSSATTNAVAIIDGTAGSSTSVTTSGWTRLSYTKSITGSGTQNKNMDVKPGMASGTFYIDDAIVYYSESSTIDLAKPTQATSAIANTSSISWTNGTDANTGIQNTLILRRTSGDADDLALNDQGLYAVSATDQSGHWTVVSNSVTSAATSYSGTFSAGDRYAIVHRDLAYNYSTPTYVTITSASCSTPAAPTEVTAGSTTSSGTTLTITDAANAASYDIYYSTSSSAPDGETEATTTSTSKTKALTGLTASTTYYVWVRSVCDESNKSDWVALTGSTFTTLCATHTVTAATSTGTNTYGTVSAASATVCEGSTTTVTASPASGYQVTNWAVSGTGASISPSGSSSSTSTTLTMGTANATVTVTFGCATPATPTALVASSTTSSGTTLTITDAANTNNYEIYYSTSSTAPEAGTSATTTSTSKTKALTGLTASTTYYVWVRSVCDSTHKSSWTALTGSTFTTDAACTDPGLTITLN